MATEHGSFDVAEMLIRAGADVDTKDKVSIIHCLDYSICHTIHNPTLSGKAIIYDFDAI